MNRRHLALLAVLGVATSLPLVAADVIVASKEGIPHNVLPFIEKGRLLLAYKSAGTSQKDGRTIAMVVRHQSGGPDPAKAEHDWEVEYACELIVLQEQRGAMHVTGRTQNVVNCAGNDKNTRAGYRDLDDSLDVAPVEVTFTNYSNTARWGWYSYSFRLDNGTWHLSAGKASYGTSQETTEFASFPKDFGYISMQDFKPDDIQAALTNNSSVSGD